MGTVNVVADHLAANGLPANVPDLQADGDVPRQLHALHKEVQADGLFVLLGEVILAKTHGQRGLPDSAVTENDDLELQVLWLRLVILVPKLRSELGHVQPPTKTLET